MWNALLWGAVAGSSILLGTVTSFFVPMKQRILGYIMAFGTGALIAATSFELLLKSIESSGLLSTTIGFLAGAGIFTAFDWYLWKNGARKRNRSSGGSSSGVGWAIFVGAIMDNIPETAMIGVSLIGNNSVSWALLAAVFISNFPEGLSSSSGLLEDGYSKKKIFLSWTAAVIITALSSLAGYVFLNGAPDQVRAILGSFAGGSIIAMVSSTMLPEAYEKSDPTIGLITALGLLIALALNTL
ncbi:ZIP family metal transporter [Pseudalkalibacillus caeni]|uniref:ZIP family metal transporter n=1 Tax=Exobacillus caeni TaxID=2574798 RepID=A0A5R9F8Q8_9BACL|nr:ZIP family metal transporter [Pseudalkalibacillus caeni]TLS37233.1 ZIP family metal transporter [Pseudalkalibacillus caeni]